MSKEDDVRMIVEQNLCSLIRKIYPDQGGINNRLDNAVSEIVALYGGTKSKGKKKKVEKAEEINPSDYADTFDSTVEPEGFSALDEEK